jgi:hypothetical protein
MFHEGAYTRPPCIITGASSHAHCNTQVQVVYRTLDSGARQPVRERQLLISPKDTIKSRDISVGIAMVYGLDSRGSSPGRGKRFFSTPQHMGCGDA